MDWCEAIPPPPPPAGRDDPGGTRVDYGDRGEEGRRCVSSVSKKTSTSLNEWEEKRGGGGKLKERYQRRVEKMKIRPSKEESFFTFERIQVKEEMLDLTREASGEKTWK